MSSDDPKLTQLDLARLKKIENEREQKIAQQTKVSSFGEDKARIKFFRKEKKRLAKEQKKLAKHSRVARSAQFKKRNTFLNKALIVIALLLFIIIACAIFL